MLQSSLSRRVRSAALGLAALTLPALASAAIVVASSGPSARDYPVGKKLDDNAKVTLRAGDVITVLDRKGTRGLRGAGSFALGGDAAAANPTFALLTRQMASSRVRTGAVRGETAQTLRSPNIWYVDTSQSGPHCYVDGSAVSLWRGAAGGPATYTVKDGAGASAAVSFGATDMLAAWNTARLAIKPGATYRIAAANGASTSVTFVQLAAAPATPDALAAALIDKGCTAQLDLLSTSLAQR